MAKKKAKTHEFLKLIGENIKKYRKLRGFSFAKLAEEVGLNSGHVYRIEKGQNLTLITLVKFSLALGVPLEKLIKTEYSFEKEELAGLITNRKTSKQKKA